MPGRSFARHRRPLAKRTAALSQISDGLFLYNETSKLDQFCVVAGWRLLGHRRTSNETSRPPRAVPHAPRPDGVPVLGLFTVVSWIHARRNFGYPLCPR